MKEIFTPVPGGFTSTCCTFLLVFFSFCLSSIATASPGLVYVHGIEKGFITVQSAVNSAKCGSVVMIPSGYWEENVVIDKSLMLMPAKGAILANLEINAPGQKVTLLADLNVEGNLKFTQGYIYNGSYNIKTGSTLGGSCSSYLMMPPSGSLTLSVPANATVNFPIGTMTAMAPVKVRSTGAHTSDFLTISVVDRASKGSFTSPGIGYNNFAKFEWNITETTSGGSQVYFDFEFPETSVNTALNLTNTVVGHNTGTWDPLDATVTLGSGIYKASTDNFQTSFSPFGVFDCAEYNGVLANGTGSSTICVGGSANIKFTMSGGTGPYTVVYNPGGVSVSNYNSGDDISVSPGSTTMYTPVSVTDVNGCTANVSGSATVTVNVLPTGTLTAVSPICKGATATFTFTATAGSNLFELVINGVTYPNITSGVAFTGPVVNSNTTFNLTKITDGNGCMSTGSPLSSATVNIETTPPSITCPANTTVNTSSGSCNQLHSWTIPTPTDACGIKSLTKSSSPFVMIFDFPPSAFALFPKGTTTITYTATDNSDNTATCSFTVTVIDNEFPVITGCPSNQSANTAPGTCAANVTWTAPTASDNCPGVTLTATHSPGSSFPKGVTTVVYTATDAAGNSVTCSFNVTVTDNQAPVITCPANITQNCEDDHTPTGAGTATATDNCPGVTVGHADVSTKGTDPDACNFYTYAISRTWTATDADGMTATCVQTINVEDVTDPVITCPSNTTVSCEDDNTSANTGVATATDNCDATPDDKSNTDEYKRYGCR
jgi:flavin reductase (DIM6/NTAB) family NADH-FMN oxidoreductase RutF